MKIEYTLSEIHKPATEVLTLLKTHPLLAFHGQMGAGKTTLIVEVCRLSGVQSAVQSPTFTLVNEYTDQDQNPIYHFDFYRIENEQEVLDIGIYEYWDSGFPCLMEWPEKIPTILEGEEVLHIYISHNGEDSRIIEWNI